MYTEVLPVSVTATCYLLAAVLPNQLNFFAISTIQRRSEKGFD